MQALLDELDREESLDADARDRLMEVLDEIRGAVEAGSLRNEEDESLVDRLNDATRQFEESHPTLTSLVGRIAESLANLGI
jgi:hypothetical protein